MSKVQIVTRWPSSPIRYEKRHEGRLIILDHSLCRTLEPGFLLCSTFNQHENDQTPLEHGPGYNTYFGRKICKDWNLEIELWRLWLVEMRLKRCQPCMIVTVDVN